jgi:NAD(P)-dependent dehydrogenase (short-subunit alcohol dehydrogenase family)
MTSVSNKVAVVVGGSRGLGRGAVEALASRGARVVVIARDPASLAALEREVPGVETLAGDAADEALAERTLRREVPDLCVVSAGALPAQGALQDQTWESFTTNWNVDTKIAFVWSKLALTIPMKAGSHLVVVSSGAAIQGSPVSGGYASAKRAQWFIADYAATEAKRANLDLRVHCVLPSLNPSTALGRAGIEAYAQRAGITAQEFAVRLNPPLTPAGMGAAIAALFEEPGRFPALAYRLGGEGLAPLG